jgi:hypothetical protein
MRPMDERAFEKLVRSYGCKIEHTTKEYKITKNGDTVSYLAINHRKGQKRLVLPVYIKEFLKAVEQLGLVQK